MLSKSVTKYIQSLQQKKFRDEQHAFIAEGPKIAAELLAENYFECEYFFCTQESTALLSEKVAKQLGEQLSIIKDFELQKISALHTANNMLAVFKKKKQQVVPDIKGKITLVLDDVQDPGNLGTIIRNADWFGVENIICSLNTADAYNPKVVQSTMASLCRVNIFYMDIEKLLLSHTQIKKYVTVLNGKDVTDVGKIKEGLIIIGNESKGISKRILQLADEKITITKKGKAESLNAGVAAGIILYALVL